MSSIAYRHSKVPQYNPKVYHTLASYIPPSCPVLLYHSTLWDNGEYICTYQLRGKWMVSYVPQVWEEQV